jgi:hypothetical protein
MEGAAGYGPGDRDKCRTSASDAAVKGDHRWNPFLPRALEE